jgi:serine/threonine protein kinase
VAYESGTDSNGSPEYELIDMAALEAKVAAYVATTATKPKIVQHRPEPASSLLEDVFDCCKPSDMSSKGGDAVKSLLRRIFQYEPEKRPQAAELLKDPWFADPEDVVAEPDRRSLLQEKRKGKRKRSSSSERHRKCMKPS